MRAAARQFRSAPLRDGPFMMRKEAIGRRLAALEHVVAGNVRFIGSNLRATHNPAHSVAATLKRSTLPETAGVVLEQETGKVSAFQITCC